MTFTAPQDLTNVLVGVFTRDNSGNFNYTGNTNNGFQVCNAVLYEGPYLAARSLTMDDYYNYVPDNMFKNSAVSNFKVRWSDT